MTIGGALSDLNNLLNADDIPCYYKPSIKAVIDTIALEQEPCEDAISRQAVLKIYNEWFNSCNIANKKESPKAQINALPSVQPKSRWIPVSEKLPEKGGDYLVTIEWKGSYSGDVYTETNMAVYREKEEEWDCAGVVAWMPLPEPYAPNN